MLLLIPIGIGACGQVPFKSVCVKGGNRATGGSHVRSWTPTKAVICYQDGNTYYFAIVENYNTTMHAVKFSGYLSISDMRILGDTLYFCGSENNVGFIDYIDLNDLEQGTLTRSNGVSFVDSTTSSKLNRVTKMAVYYSPSDHTPRIAAIGEWSDTIPSGPGWYIGYPHAIIEAYFTSGSMDAKWVTCNSSGVRIQDVPHDVEVTDSYVAFVGYGINTTYLGIRKSDKDNILGSSMINTIYNYPIPAEQRPVAAAMVGDEIAVATAYDTITNRENRLEICMFDLSTMDMFEVQTIKAPTKSAAEEMIFMPADNKLLLIPMLNEPSGFLYPVIYVKPRHTLPYSTDAVLSRCMQSLSIDIHDSYYFLLGGVNSLFAHHIPTLSANDSCIDLLEYEVRGWDKVGYTAQNDPVVIKNQYLPHMIPMSPCTDSYNSQCIYQ